jgi:hypothetical protein
MARSKGDGSSGAGRGVSDTDSDLSVSDRLAALKALFSKWALDGVPSGLAFPKSLRALLTWTCPPAGILIPIGSKRDISMRSSEYKADVQQINALIKKLKPVATQPKKRVYTTSKARRVAAEDESALYKSLLDGVTKQWEELSEDFESVNRDYISERHENSVLRKELAELQQENALLKRKLASKDGVLSVITS